MKYETRSDFVIPYQDVRDGDTIQLVDEGEWRKLPGQDKEVLTFTVRLPNGEEKLLSINKTSQQNLTVAFDPDPENKDTKNWMNKDIKVEIAKMNVMGKMVNVIFLTPVALDLSPGTEAPKKKEPAPKK